MTLNALRPPALILLPQGAGGPVRERHPLRVQAARRQRAGGERVRRAMADEALSAAHRTVRGSCRKPRVIIEYLGVHYPGPVKLIPDDADAAIEVRMMDRFFDNYVMNSQSRVVFDFIRPEGNARSPMAWPRRRRCSTPPMPGSTAGWRAANGPRAARSAWPTAPRRRGAALCRLDSSRSRRTMPMSGRTATRLLARPSYAQALDERGPRPALFPARGADRSGLSRCPSCRTGSGIHSAARRGAHNRALRLLQDGPRNKSGVTCDDQAERFCCGVCVDDVCGFSRSMLKCWANSRPALPSVAQRIFGGEHLLLEQLDHDLEADRILVDIDAVDHRTGRRHVADADRRPGRRRR